MGTAVGVAVGTLVGSAVGSDVGCTVGAAVGSGVHCRCAVSPFVFWPAGQFVQSSLPQLDAYRPVSQAMHSVTDEDPSPMYTLLSGLNRPEAQERQTSHSML